MTASTPLGFDPDALREKYRRERDKRLRADGNEQYVEVKGRFAHFLDDPYAAPGFTRAPLADEVEVGDDRRRLRRTARGRAPAPGRRREHPHDRPGQRLRRHLVLEPLSRASPATSSRTSTCPCSKRSATCPTQKYSDGAEILALQPGDRAQVRSLPRRAASRPASRSCPGTRRRRAGSSRRTTAIACARATSAWRPGR